MSGSLAKPEIRVLLIEDDEDDYVLTRELLSETSGEQIHLDWAPSFEEGLRAIERGVHDVCLIDYRLGARDGLDLLREARGRGCEAPLILLTGQGDTEVDLAAMRAGAADYLVKSQISAPILDRAIRYAVERRRNEDRLRRSEQRFRDLVDGLDAIVWEADAQTFAFQFVSRRAEAILGYPVSEWQTGGGFWNRLIHPEDREQAWAGYSATAQAGRDEEFRHRAIAADGRTVWLRNNVHVIRDTQGRPERLRGVMVDITPSKQAEARQAAMVSGLRSVLAAADELLSCADLESLLRRAVELARQHLGLERCGISLLDDHGRLVMPTFGTSLEGKTTDERACRYTTGVDWNALLPHGGNGGARWTLREEVPLKEWDGQGYRELPQRSWLAISPIQSARGLIGALFNDTARTGAPVDAIQQEVTAVYCSLLGSLIENKRAEEALRGSETRLANAQRVAHLGSWEYDFERGTLEWSDETFRILGFSPAEHTPTGDLFWQAVHPDDHEAVRAGIFDAQQMERRVDLEHRVVRPDGSERVVREQAEFVRDTAGRPLRLVGTIHDITDRKLLEEQLRQSQKMEAVGRLAGGVAHDFNNMLAVITGYSELLLESNRLEPFAHSGLQEIKKASDRAATLTRQLLAFSRKSMLSPQVLDLNQVVEGMAGMLRRLIGENIQLAIEPTADLGHVKADPGQISQVLMNLVVNARDAMPEGGRILIRTANVELSAAYATQHAEVTAGRYTRLSLSDTGCGMDATTLARVFEPFFTTKAPGQGTGLGLAMVYGIVTQSGGHITVTSEPGKGSTFHVYLPQTDQPGRVPGAGTGFSAVPSRTGTLLVVEDEDMLRGLIRSILEGKGYRVLDTQSAEQALEILKRPEVSVDLLLTDVVMPGLSGRDLARQAVELHPRLRVVYMSGYSDEMVLQHGVLQESVAFLQKPFTHEALVQKVATALADPPIPEPSQ